MGNYLLRRLVQLIPVLIGISIAVSLVLQLVPGDIVSGMLGIEETPELRAQLEQKYGLNKSPVIQYFSWISGVVRGDFGESFRTGVPILPEMLTRFGVTAELAILSIITSWIIAIPLGILAALHRNGIVDRFVRVFALLGVSIPGFAFSILVILLLSLTFNYYPPLKYVKFIDSPIENIKMMFLPSLILGMRLSGSVMRMTRSSVLETLQQDYIKTVRAKGATMRTAVFRHAFRNALIPIITLVGLQMASLLGGAVIIEQIFSLPGLGQMVLTAINQRDYPVVQGCVLFIAMLVVTINLLTDLLYGKIDPRISYN